MSLDSQNLDSEIKISACILVKNAQSTILQCLNSLAQFDEIILLDNGSTDDTLKIATQFNANFQNLKVFQSEFIGFGALKNLAISHASHDWIFSIDSDEVLESGAYDEMKKIISKSAPTLIASLPRKNMYRGEWIKACGWWPDFVIRLFNRRFTKFNDVLVHESVQVPKNAKQMRLNHALKHYTCENMQTIIDKMNRYTTHSAQEKFKNKKRASVFGAISRFWLIFFKDYFLRSGFKYGYKGFIIALLNAQGAFFRYMKLYELNYEKNHNNS